MARLFQSAIDNWPVDEARAVIEQYRNTMASEDEGYARECLAKNIELFAKVFSFEPDGDVLNKRFLAVLKNDGVI